MGSTPAAAASDLRYQSSWALDLYGAPKSLSSHMPVFTGAGSIPAVSRAVSSAVYGRRKPALANSAVNTTSRLTTSIERVTGRQAAHHLLPLRGGGARQRLDAHLVGAARGVRALFGACGGAAVVGQDVPRQRRGTALTPAAGQQRCRDQRCAGQRDCPSSSVNGRTEFVSCILVCRAAAISTCTRVWHTSQRHLGRLPLCRGDGGRRLAKAVAELRLPIDQRDGGIVGPPNG